MTLIRMIGEWTLKDHEKKVILQIYTNTVKRYGRKIVELKYIRLMENGQEEWKNHYLNILLLKFKLTGNAKY